MIVVHRSVGICEGSLDEAIALSVEYAHRSRTEPGCIAHAVHSDCESPNRLACIDEWVDRAALEQHFQVPASKRFVADLVALAREASIIAIHDAERLGRLWLTGFGSARKRGRALRALVRPGNRRPPPSASPARGGGR